MERAQLLERLAEVRRHVDQAEAHIVEQRTLLGQLAHRGDDLTKAQAALRAFEKIQDNYLFQLNRLLDDLDKIPRTNDDAHA
jgi:hypothetical protein